MGAFAQARWRRRGDSECKILIENLIDNPIPETMGVLQRVEPRHLGRPPVARAYDALQSNGWPRES